MVSSMGYIEDRGLVPDEMAKEGEQEVIIDRVNDMTNYPNSTGESVRLPDGTMITVLPEGERMALAKAYREIMRVMIRNTMAEAHVSIRVSAGDVVKNPDGTTTEPDPIVYNIDITSRVPDRSESGV